MCLRVHILSAHPLAVCFLVQMLSVDPELRKMLSGESLTDLASLRKLQQPCLFVIDTCFLPVELTQLTRLLRVRCRGSKFLVLIPGERSNHEEMLRLLYAGVDGIVSLTKDLQKELPVAVRVIQAGNLWIPPQVKAEYVEQTYLLLDKLQLSGLSLTAREIQILHLMVRRLSNKEIAAKLGTAERTVKFHVSNILSKFRVENRRNLLATMKAAPQFKPFSA